MEVPVNVSDPCCPPQPCCPDVENKIPFTVLPGKRKDLPPSVVGEVMTPAGPVPRVSADMSSGDRLGIWRVRWGIGRMKYTVAPGLYSLGEPDGESEVLVTANYRMTFDLLRSSLHDVNAWILVLDTSGINVWCAAGKGTFGTDELVRRVEFSDIAAVVSHRRLIVPQLGAPGVAAHEVRERTGFKVFYGPVELKDIPAYLENGRRATPAMRRKEFPLTERAALIPLELVPASKWVIIATLTFALLAGIMGGGSFASDALSFGIRSFALLVLGTFVGTVLTPILLPWVPGRAFALKGAITGVAAALLLLASGYLSGLDGIAWLLLITVISSFLAMNFTGSSTYTSLSGVKKEMRIAVPVQIGASVIAIVLWVSSFLTSGGTA
jgi:acetyl-CoA decarbonylase/synthase complex subunit gamma